MINLVALVSCGRSKRTGPAPAKDMYTSQLFRGMRRYAETNAAGWYILSAKHGLLFPDQIIEPYELNLKRMSRALKSIWACQTAAAIERLIPRGTRLLILAGSSYIVGLEPLLQGHYLLDDLMSGLTMGKRLSWLKCANSIRQEPPRIGPRDTFPPANGG